MVFLIIVNLAWPYGSGSYGSDRDVWPYGYPAGSVQLWTADGGMETCQKFAAHVNSGSNNRLTYCVGPKFK